MIHRLLLIAVAVLCFASYSAAQTFKSPVEYLDYIAGLDEELSKNYLNYMQAVAHSNSARKMEKRRQDVVTAIQEANRTLSRLRPWQGDAQLRDAYREYFRILLSVFNEDYHKIVDMEEIAEQSYDAMEAYLLAQDKARERLALAAEQLEPAYRKFAVDNKITIVEGNESKRSKRMRQVSGVNAYYRPFFLMTFKTTKQEVYMLKALEEKDVNGLEQNRSTLLRYAKEAMQQLDTMKPYKGDGSLITACRRVLEFQKEEAETKITPYIDYILKMEEFDKIKKAYEAKPANQRTKADVDQYNKAVSDINAEISKFNKDNMVLFQARTKVYDNWDNARKRFLSAHIPNG